MVSCGAGVSGCEFRGSGWGWDRRCQDPGARGLGPGSWGTIPYGGGGVATRNTGPYIYIHIRTHKYTYFKGTAPAPQVGGAAGPGLH